MLQVLDLDGSAQFSLDSCWSSLDQRWLRGSVTVSFFSLTRAPFFKRLNLPLSVSKPTVICPEFLWEVRWLPRLSQPHKVFVVSRSFAGCTFSPCVVCFGFFLHCRLPLSAFPWQWFLDFIFSVFRDGNSLPLLPSGSRASHLMFLGFW